MKSNKSLVLRGSIISIGLGFFIIMILSLSGQNAFVQETIPTASGSTTAIIKTCNPLIPLPSNPISGALCGTLSSNVSSSSTTTTAPVTVKTPVIITPQQNQTVKLSSQTSSVNVSPTNGQTITITSQTGSTITAITASGQTISATSITATSGVTLTSTNDVVISTNTPQPITVTPQNGGSVILTTNSTLPSSLSIVSSNSCPNGGIPVGNPAVCPTSTTIIPPPVCSASQTASGYTVQGSNCVAPPPVCSASQTASGYTVQGSVSLGWICSPPPAEPVSISSVGYIIDNLGNNQTLASTNIPIGLQSFIAQHGSNNNIDHGKISLGLKFKGNANTMYQANGTLKVYINSNSLHPQGIFWSVNGITDGNGEILANIQIPSGISQYYIMNISDRASMINLSMNNINFTLSNLQIQNMQNGKKFHSINEQSILGIVLDYDGSMIIKQNSQGQSIRGYPDDNTFSLNSAKLYIAGGQQVCHFTPYGKQSCGYTQDQVIAEPNNVGTASVYIEATGGFEKLFDTTTVKYISIPGYPNNGHTIINIPWDADIKIVVSGGIGSYNKIFHTPKSHMDWSYTCTGNIGCSTNLP